MVELFEEIFYQRVVRDTTRVIFVNLGMPSVDMWINYLKLDNCFHLDMAIRIADTTPKIFTLKSYIRPKCIKEWLTALRQLTERVSVEW